MSFEVITVIVVLVFFTILSLMAHKAEKFLAENPDPHLQTTQNNKTSNNS
ncbi:MAG TPA: hypothetical protein PLZ08_01565 [Bacillota bacterium]|jgi:hypothetical protein|nr:hypothetical protein [Bacillota bacterium]HOL08667.1 hypothetical protein [Bacillota bacterium]HPO96631.1 hypothetical protein [Bacillota bacterium]